MEKHIHQQRKLNHNFIDLKKAFDRVWHTMTTMDITIVLINIITSQYIEYILLQQVIFY